MAEGLIRCASFLSRLSAGPGCCLKLRISGGEGIGLRHLSWRRKMARPPWCPGHAPRSERTRCKERHRAAASVTQQGPVSSPKHDLRNTSAPSTMSSPLSADETVTTRARGAISDENTRTGQVSCHCCRRRCDPQIPHALRRRRSGPRRQARSDRTIRAAEPSAARWVVTSLLFRQPLAPSTPRHFSQPNNCAQYAPYSAAAQRRRR